MGKTKIEWATDVWNPVTGCTKVSAGCKNCWAERMFPRVYASQSVPSNGSNSVIENTGVRPRRFTDVHCHPERLEQPLHWSKPRRIFVCSMSDLFHDAVPESFIAKVFNVARVCEQHTFIVLTKRPQRMAEILGRWKSLGNQYGWVREPLRNVWLGVSIEDRKAWEERGLLLKVTPAALRFLSIEPLIADLGQLDLTGILWVIVGGESGPGARPCRIEWIESAIEQCRTAGVAVFLKQLGAFPIWAGAKSTPTHPARGKCHEPDEWPVELRFREWPL